MVLLFIVVYDLRHTVIPWSASGILALLALVSLVVSLDTTPIFIFTPFSVGTFGGAAPGAPARVPLGGLRRAVDGVGGRAA